MHAPSIDIRDIDEHTINWCVDMAKFRNNPMKHNSDTLLTTGNTCYNLLITHFPERLI